MKLFEAWEDVEERRSAEELAEHVQVERLMMGMQCFHFFSIPPVLLRSKSVEVVLTCTSTNSRHNARSHQHRYLRRGRRGTIYSYSSFSQTHRSCLPSACGGDVSSLTRQCFLTRKPMVTKSLTSRALLGLATQIYPHTSR